MVKGISKLYVRGRSERGFAVPTVLVAIIAAFALGSAAVVASIHTQSGTTRDQNTKAALAAAEAGVSEAMLRFNRIATSSEADACLPVGGGAPDATNWCPPTPETTDQPFDRGTFSYRVGIHPASGSTPAQLEIVSTGTVDGVTRRVRALADTISGGFKPFQDASVVGLDSIMLNSKATIEADVATNGNIGLNANSSLICGDAQVGVGKGFNPNNGNSTVTCDPVQGTTTLPPVNPGDVATNNSNDRICTVDPMTGQQCASWSWNPSTKRLLLNSGATLTLGAPGGTFNYAFCKVTLNSNSYLYIAAESNVRIYFLAPEDCGGESEPLTINSNSKIQPTGSAATQLALLVVGSPSKETRMTLNSNAILFGCDQAFVLYAPRTDLTINSNTHICGATATKSILVNSNSTITATSTAEEWELPGADEGPSYYGEPHDFIECSPTPTGATPDSGC
jgi:Tfp pilus assembly protein PilX